MKMCCAFFVAAFAAVALPAQAGAYDLVDSVTDAATCEGRGTGFAPSIAAACSRLIENIDEAMPGLEDDLDLYYLYRSFAHDESGKKELACADALKALELMPNAATSRTKWMVSAERVKKSNC